MSGVKINSSGVAETSVPLDCTDDLIALMKHTLSVEDL
jgi:hypothetical protein